MRQLKYNDASQIVRLDFPWSGIPSAITLAVKNAGGTDLLAAAATTIPASDTLNGAIVSGATSLVLTTGTGLAPVAGDRLYIASSAAGRDERVEVASYVSATKTVALKTALEYSHSTGTAVKALWCTYALNTATTTTWINGIEVTLLWSPDLDEPVHTELARIVTYGFASEKIQERFRALYPALYQVIALRWTDILDEGLRRLRLRLKRLDRDLDDLRDQELIQPALIELLAVLATAGGGDEWRTEYEHASARFTDELNLLQVLPIWMDTDQDAAHGGIDTTESDDEIDTWEPFMLERRW